jgi:anti-anti-sigma factor
MLEDLRPVQWDGPQAVVALPEHINVSNAGQIREELLSVINCGAVVLIADMTVTISCDHAGADALVSAHQRAIIAGTELRLVVTAQIVSRVLNLSGLDRLVPVYPSMEAATAARAPAATVNLGTWTGSDGHVPRRPAGQPRARFSAAGPWDGNGADITPAVVPELLDSLPDVPGRPVDSLIPADLQAAHRGHRNVYARAPGICPMDAGTRLAGLRKDGTTFPAEVSLCPVTTVAGHFTLAVIRDVTEALRLADLAGLARASVAAEQEYRSRELLDTIITSLFHVGLSLHAAVDLPAEAIRQCIAEALAHLDDTIREIRDAEFTIPGHDTMPGPAPLNGAGVTPPPA